MSAIGAAQWTAVATIVLAVFAVIGGGFALAAWRAQDKQVKALEAQATDQKELIGQQAQLLQVQGDQLDLQRQQFENQREVNARQAEVMELEAQELRESRDDRVREAEARRRAQATHVFIWMEPLGDALPTVAKAHVANTSREPVYDIQVRWYRGTAADGGPDQLPTVFPERTAGTSHEFPAGTNMKAVDVVARFRDAAGVYWRRRLDGTLTDLDSEGSKT